MELSDQQRAAEASLTQWAANREQKSIFRLFGYAGTGKTTIAKHLVEKLGLSARYAAYTGKAASVMQSRGMRGATTLHSLVYCFDGAGADGRPIFSWAGEMSPLHRQTSLLVIDECSMVGPDLANDILRYRVPLLVIGDPAQLPPVQGGGYFTQADPDFMLTDIHRQAAGSPVIHLATQVRSGARLAPGSYGDSAVMPASAMTDDRLFNADQILVGTNAKRIFLNRKLRKHFGIEDVFPNFGEKLVCLQNNRTLGAYNGEMFRVVCSESVGEKHLKMTLVRDDENGDVLEDVLVHKGNFDKEFLDKNDQIPRLENVGCLSVTFGYAMTVHKAQGSQWENVVLFDESRTFRDAATRWLYTGITRAAKTITIVQGA